jgi:hypothetical protein
MSKSKATEELSDPSNAAAETIEISNPYTFSVEIEGTADFLYHRWNVEAVEEKSKAAKGSKAKKSDDVESYVYRTENGNLGIPGEYLRQSLIHAGKFRQDPRSPRKSAMDLVKAGVVSVTPLSDTGLNDWDYIDRRRVVVQRNGITRSRPALKAGWRVGFDFLIMLPEYLDSHFIQDLVAQSGRLIGIGDFRPTYGRFAIKKWEVVQA